MIVGRARIQRSYSTPEAELSMKDRTSTDGRAHGSFSLSERVQYRVAMVEIRPACSTTMLWFEEEKCYPRPDLLLCSSQKKYLILAPFLFSKTSSSLARIGRTLKSTSPGRRAKKGCCQKRMLRLVGRTSKSGLCSSKSANSSL